MAAEGYDWAPLGVKEICDLFGDWPGSWGIAGGWALDLHLGRQTRRHDDIDVLLPLGDQGLLHERLGPEWELHLAEGGVLTRLHPAHRLTAETDIWVRRDAGAPWAFQVMLIDAGGGEWSYRRARSVKRPVGGLFLRTADGVPYLRPEVQLLYKGGGRTIREKDERDLGALLPALTEGERAWLGAALRAQFPEGHPWLARLGAEGGAATARSSEPAGAEAGGARSGREAADAAQEVADGGPPPTRPYLRLIQRAAAADGVRFEAITPELTYRARRGGRSFLMTDAELGLNPGSASALAISKSAGADVLRAAGVPAVAHEFVPHPGYRFGGGTDAAYARAAEALARFGGDAVVKPDDGAQGRHVYRVREERELREALDAIFALERHAAISPYREAELEYRVVVLAGEARVWVGKRRTASWKHNLAEGARSIPVAAADRARLSPLAVEAAAELDMVFCSVDILDTARHGPLVIEINHKVMLGDHYRQHPESEEELVALYRDAIRLRFERM